MGWVMELRHLRYFVAVAEEGSLTLAAERRLHTAQPSLSRQIRDLENELGVELLVRGSRGIALTAAGEAYLSHARLILAQSEAAIAAARNAAHSGRQKFALGFLTGCEPQWLPGVMRVLRDELPQIEITISSRHSPQLAEDVAAGKLDAAFMRVEQGYPRLAYDRLISEPLVVVMPSDHPLARRDSVHPTDLVGQTFVGMANQAPVLRNLIEDYLRKAGVQLEPAHRVEYISMAISVVASTRGVCLLPQFTRNFLTWSVVARPLLDAPTIDLVLAYRKDNNSKTLKRLLSRTNELIAAERNGSPSRMSRP